MSDELKTICDDLAESGLDAPPDMSAMVEKLSDASKMDALIGENSSKAQTIGVLARSLLGDYARHLKLLESYKAQIDKVAIEASKLAARHPVKRGGLPPAEKK